MGRWWLRVETRVRSLGKRDATPTRDTACLSLQRGCFALRFVSTSRLSDTNEALRFQ